MKLTLYDPVSDEVIKEYSRSFVPWRLLKQAIRLSDKLDPESLDEETIDELAALVVSVFGDQFSVQELNEGADLGEMMAVLTAIVNRAGASMPNPTRPG